MLRHFTYVFFLSLIICQFSFAQKPPKPNASEIYEAIEKLNFVGSAMFVAAHPDDENTRLISYLANSLKAQTAYLSITRGDGGQNLIGPELGSFLGAIRTQELLAARRTDGGQQMFTRAVDFGYSKHPDETFAIWDKQKILADVVFAIRKHRPDVIINRFDHRSPGTTHGHHTGSAMLSYEAFSLAGNPEAFPEQLDKVSVWKPRRMFFNTSWWFYGSQEKFEQADKSGITQVEVGDFYPSVGLSNGEIAALSRSQHKSQGFGSTGSRGAETEYLEFIQGQAPRPKYKNDLFDGIDTGWGRLENGAAIQEVLDLILMRYDHRQPEASIPLLLDAQVLISKLKDDHWRRIKLTEINEIIAACSGLFVEAVAEKASAVPGESIKINVEAINRSNFPVTLSGYKVSLAQNSEIQNLQLNNNVSHTLETTVTLPDDTPYNSPYWLQKEKALGIFTVDQPRFIGLPESPAAATVDFLLSFGGKSTVLLRRDVVYKSNSRVEGEVYEPLMVLPPATVGIDEKVWIFTDNTAQKIPVKVVYNQQNISGTVHLQAPDGWRVSPESINFKAKGLAETFEFTVTPPSGESSGTFKPFVEIKDKRYALEKFIIDYQHIPKQTILMPAVAQVSKTNLKKAGLRIAYLHGAGDDIPQSLRQVGYEVTELKPEEITSDNLSSYDALVIGIRAYNVYDQFEAKQKEILAYVEQGGTVVTQYNTTGDLKLKDFAPYPLKISRDRVIDEQATAIFLAPNHPVMNYPNKIGASDFDGWVQERGLYFPNEWDAAYTPILGMKDPQEATELQGSLLVASYGKGFYVYTGLSFFRELPAGVPGAFKLFANLLALGQNGQP
jgi:LmbE family N-acetylglucosaminyl deacetylase